MKKFILFKNRFLLMALILVSSDLWAEKYNYHANVKGMVCAYCAYSVSKNISTLPGVVADTIDVSLQQGYVTFSSLQEVSESKLSDIFNDSGFTISDLRLTVNPENFSPLITSPNLDLNFKVAEIVGFARLIESIGSIAASSTSRLEIKAPKSYENEILKPLLMGRQQVIKINFIPVESESIHIRLYNSATTGS